MILCLRDQCMIDIVRPGTSEQLELCESSLLPCKLRAVWRIRCPGGKGELSSLLFVVKSDWTGIGKTPKRSTPLSKVLAVHWRSPPGLILGITSFW